MSICQMVRLLLDDLQLVGSVQEGVGISERFPTGAAMKGGMRVAKHTVWQFPIALKRTAIAAPEKQNGRCKQAPLVSEEGDMEVYNIWSCCV